MNKELVSDTHILLFSPVLAGAAFLIASIKNADFPIIYILLISVFVSLLSLFIIPRYIRKGIESKDSKRIILSLIISVLAAAPFIIALGSWINYAG